MLSPHDDKNPLIDLLCCVDCQKPMKLERSIFTEEADGDLIQYRCRICARIERVLLRRSVPIMSGV